MFSPADQIPSIIEILTELNHENGVPKNIKLKLNNVIAILNGTEDASVRANKALIELDEVSEDSNISQFRAEIWNVVSVLSKIN